MPPPRGPDAVGWVRMDTLSGGHPRTPGISGTPDRAGGREEVRCPSCSRLLLLRSGPAITPHFAHRPRQSCRNRPGRPRGARLRLEQLTLFELEALIPAPAAARPPAEPAFGAGGTTATPVTPVRRPTQRRRRRRAWLPRLIRWLKAQRR